jgi:hypothetical protein
MSDTPYTSGPHIVEADGGEETRIMLRTPHRGRIKSVKFEQIAGTPAACAFELYTSVLAAPPGEPSSGSLDMPSESLSESVQGPRSAYSVFGEKNMNSGAVFAEYEKDYVFRNADGTSTNPQRRLYLAVRPDGSGVKQFALTLEMETSPV